MTTTLITSQPDELRVLLPWGRAIARSAGTDLAVVLTARKRGPVQLSAVSEQPDDDESESVQVCRSLIQNLPGDSDEADADAADSSVGKPGVSLYRLTGDEWSQGLAEHLQSIQTDVVVVPAPVFSRDQRPEEDWQTAILDQLECEVILLQDDTGREPDRLRVGVVLKNAAESEAALLRAVQLCADNDAATCTAVCLQPRVGDLTVSVGMRQIGGLMQETLNRYQQDAVERQVVIADSFGEGMQQVVAEDFDLIMVGATDLTTMRRFFFVDPGEPEGKSGPARAVLRPAESISTRLWSRVGRRVRSNIPQLTRQERVDLVSRIQSSSQWDFDFVFLVSLSALIACLGLAENSGAVIVGAMLVAPLMTPIIGVGLGVAHGNALLTRMALRTALRGFAVALGTSILFGLAVQLAAGAGWLDSLHNSEAQPNFWPLEMANRTRPQFYDLLIALASGVAAAYAMGRPDLSAALPGVAIAAALVPPITTSGILISHLELKGGSGALLLFATNMVTIILGASVIFRAVGIRSQKDGPDAAKWPRYTLLLLVILSVLATAAMQVL